MGVSLFERQRDDALGPHDIHLVKDAPSSGEPRASQAHSVRAAIGLLRPHHWVKNLFVLAPLLFSGKALRPQAWNAVEAFIAFCLVASFGYIVNDLFDLKSDRRHPTKRYRPLPSGRITRPVAIALAVVLGVASLLLAWRINGPTTLFVAGYMALIVAYSARLKRVVLLDLFALASFFVLRLLGGAAAIESAPSVWLLLCGGLLALYLGVTKRQHEMASVTDANHRRPVLQEYSPALLDQLSVVLIAATFLTYCQYSLTSDTARGVGNDGLAYGTPFALYGLLRYQYLVTRRGAGSPVETVLTDSHLLVSVGCWVAYNGWVLYRGLI